MSIGSMNVEERILAAVSLEPVDRHPVFPILVTAAPRLRGITQGEAWRDHEKAREALLWCWREFGYDVISKPNYYYPMIPGRFCGAPVRNLIPGRQLPEDALYQIDERVLFPREDYDRIAALGWNAYWEENYEAMSGKPWESLKAMMELSNRFYVEDMRKCEEEGASVSLGVAVDSVMMAFSLCRTLVEFTRDLREVPDKVEAAMRASCEDLIENAIRVCKENGKMTAFVVLERGSGFYYPLEVFERFEWPFLQRYVDAFIAEGILPWLHFDTDWGINLPHLRRLPRGKCVCDLDGMTDIFRAKEILGGHMCISGDVPAALLTLGRPDDVAAYCRRLIDEVGEGGGFMLTTGCECPVDVKPENLRAMVQTGLEYRGGRRTPGDKEPAVAVEAAAEFTLPAGEISEAFSQLLYDEVKAKAKEAISRGEEVMAVIEECRRGMEIVGEKYSAGEYFLSELIISGEIFKEVLEELEPLMASGGAGRSLGPVVIGTPSGDIHDIGKNIVATLFKAAGFDVRDLGVDVAPDAFVREASESGAPIVAMSALITPAFESMREVVESLERNGLREGRFVIIGGGPTTTEVRDYVGADAWTLDPKRGVDLCRDFLTG
ncbi:MAG: uroporphyrinogen decarboxylase family protein [Actinomycetota bacterium]|nr:uroporphyrinogen decarboxylase family protein [Actinomycetota bacterium]